MLLVRKQGLVQIQECEHQSHVGAQKQRLFRVFRADLHLDQTLWHPTHTQNAYKNDDKCCPSATGDSHGKARITGRDDSEILKDDDSS